MSDTPTDMTGERTPLLRRPAVRILVVVVALILLAVGSFLWWASTPLGPDPVALDALRSDADVRVTETDLGFEFKPARFSAEPSSALIFYPGGRVDYRSYARLCRRVAIRGYLVVLVRMPLSLAVFAPDRGSDVIAAHPKVHTWVVGGHSLGGAMAGQFAHDRISAIRGLALVSSYPPASVNLRDSGLAVTSVYGTNEGIASSPALEESRERLPAGTVWVAIEGGNHAQAGDYGPQPGDSEASITPSDQQSQDAAAIVGTLVRAASH
ncbi:MAG: alpha/beta hydrolase [Coriobacteriia bacterium]|nr:alpha/beta hydrolase [Coriobacteriia bacterium]